MLLDMDDVSRSQVDLIREAFYYQSRFDGTTMVFKIDFPVTEEPSFTFLMKDLALLAQTGIRIVIVPGAKQWIDSVLQEFDMPVEYSSGVRVTSDAALPFVKMAAFDVATRFVTELSASRVDAVIGNFVRARGLGVVDGLDFRRSGTVDRIQVEPLRRLLDLGMVPILPCIGWNAAGTAYNLPSDEIALAVCKALGAVKFFIVQADEGLRSSRFALPASIVRDEGGRVARLTPAEAKETLALNKGQDNLNELDLALRASKAGVERVHLVDGRAEGAVLRELFSNLGAGTMIYADEYECIRPMAADDADAVLRIMENLMASGILVRRTREDLLVKLDDYVVYDIDDSVHACGALHDWGEAQAEIAAIATDPAWSDQGLGRRIVRYLIERAAKRGFTRVFALTTRTHDWFESLGFTEVDADSLPERKRAIYDRKRKSRVFALDLLKQ